ncbi:MAG: RNA ligase family protein [Nanoarchaeota archaeon]
MYKKYCEIENLYRGIEVYDLPSVVCTEKLHGTNVRVGCIDGVFITGGRNQVFTEVSNEEDWLKDQPYEFDSFGFTRWLKQNNPTVFQQAKRLNDLEFNFILFGEFFGQGINKGIDYGEGKHFFAFDVWFNKSLIHNEERFGSYFEMYDIAKALGVSRVPVLYAGKPDYNKFLEIYEVDSIVAKDLGVQTTPNVIEGIVITSDGLALNKFGERPIFKFKNDKFAEKAKQKATKVPIDPATREGEKRFIEEYVVAERLNHVLQHLREDSGLIITDMTNTKEVIAEMIKDLQKECAEEIEQLNHKVWGGLAAKKTAELLKEYLNG